MQYLVLRNFRSFGNYLTRGMVVDASQVRSPRLRMSEGKIVLAVSSSLVPVESAPEEAALQATPEVTKVNKSTLKLQLSK